MAPDGVRAFIPSEGTGEGEATRPPPSPSSELTAQFAERVTLADKDSKADLQPTQDLKQQPQYSPLPISLLIQHRLTPLCRPTTQPPTDSGSSRITHTPISATTPAHRTILPPTPSFQRLKHFVPLPTNEEAHLDFLPEGSPLKGKAKALPRKAPSPPPFYYRQWPPFYVEERERRKREYEERWDAREYLGGNEWMYRGVDRRKRGYEGVDGRDFGEDRRFGRSHG